MTTATKMKMKNARSRRAARVQIIVFLSSDVQIRDVVVGVADAVVTG